MTHPKLSYQYAALCMIATHIMYATPSIQQRFNKLFKRTVHEKIIQKEYPLNGRKIISIKNTRGNIRVSEWKNQSLLVNAIKKSPKPEYLDLVSIDDSKSDKNSIKIETTFSPKQKNALKTSIDYDLVVPENVRLELVSDNGNILVKEVNGHIEAKTCKAGNIEIDNAQSSICAQAENRGSIVINQAHHNVKAFAQRGNITIHNAKKGIIAQTEKGKLDVECLQVPTTSKITLNTRSGNITLRIPESTNAELQAHTEKGTVTCAHYLTVKPMTTQLGQDAWTRFQQEIEGTFGSGEADITVHTQKGNIKILDIAA